MVKDYSRKRWLILSLLSVEIDMFVTWLCPLDLENREVVAGQVGKEAAKNQLAKKYLQEIQDKTSHKSPQRCQGLYKRSEEEKNQC